MFEVTPGVSENTRAVRIVYEISKNNLEKSSKTGEIIVYLNFPSVKHYLGSNGHYRKSLPGQIFFADLIIEQACQELASRKVSKSGVTASPQALPGLIEREKNEFSRRWGGKFLK